MRREFSYQAFQRSFSLPEAKVEGGKISAKYTDGILYVTIPKREEAKLKPARQIRFPNSRAAFAALTLITNTPPDGNSIRQAAIPFVSRKIFSYAIS